MNKFLLPIILFLGAAIQLSAQEGTIYPTSVSQAVYFDVSPPLRDIIPHPPIEVDRTWKTGVVKNFFNLRQPDTTPVADLAVQTRNGKWVSSGIGVNIMGIGNINNVMPPDTDGDVGPNHYFQMINLSFQIFNKNGVSLYGPAANSTIWSGFPGPWSGSNDGDPIVMYDEYADRWIASQFALPTYPNGPFWELVAVSTTPDPTGSWYRYAFQFADMPDYPKLGVWHNAYLLTVNRFSSGTTQYKGIGAYALERSKMLTGDPTAGIISFTFGSSAEPYSMLPADADGPTPPPATEPAYFAYKKDPNKLVIYKMNIDWANTTNSTFGPDQSLFVTSYSTSISGIPQPGTTRKLDAITDRLMQRLQYRNFGTHETMVTCHTVNVSGTAGVRWYEVRKTPSTPWAVHQQATYSIDATNRWMGSIAMDGLGNIALGYSVSSATVHPGIRYTGRMANDPLNEMTIAETEIIAGGGSQTGGFVGNGRWGDYSAMVVDPSSPATFWYTTQYMQSTSSQGWKTRIASFSFDVVFSMTLSASPGTICIGESSQLNAVPAGGSGNFTYSWTSDPAGFTSNLQNPVVSPTDTTLYICSIFDGTNTITDTIAVNVNFPATAIAGEDGIVCGNAAYGLNGQATNYNTLIWSTSGDGTFSLASVINPTYTPGPNDILNGVATLTLTAYPNSPCPDPAVDALELTIVPAPVVSAGQDTTVCLWELPFVCLGEASGTSALIWTTNGDGTFGNPSDPGSKYFPGANDILTGSVVLKLTGDPVSPCTGQASDEITLILDPCVGIGEVSAEDIRIVVLPNPSQGFFTLTASGLKKGTAVITITDGKGAEVYRRTVPVAALDRYKIDIQNQPAGIYWLKVDSGSNSSTQKLIVQ